ncbi:hypothetical protein [Nocardioides zeicaulis]|uniref:Uncharacterized protein n=1 Tax=Nocardioides zeicaulis TaxID=1776857 RepID=A0ABV6E1J0_9ACTN
MGTEHQDAEQSDESVDVAAMQAEFSRYVPRGTAKRLAKLMDAGTDLVAISLRGSGPGSEGVNPQILFCDRSVRTPHARLALLLTPVLSPAV